MKKIILTLILALGLVSCFIEETPTQRTLRYHNNYWLFDSYYYSPYPYNPYRYYDVPHTQIIYSTPKVIIPRGGPNHQPRQNSLYPQYSPRKNDNNAPSTAPIRTFPGRKH